MATIPLPTPTQNPVPSTDIRDAVFAGAKLDEEVTGTGLSYTDRLGGNHLTAKGRDQQFQQAQSLRESQFSAQLSDQESRFEDFLSNSGYQLIGDYTDGPLTVDEYNQVIRYDGELWKLTADTAIPFTTTGNDSTSWANDSTHFVSVGDAALRQELSQPGGSSLIGGIEITAESFGVVSGTVGITTAKANADKIMQKAAEISAAGGGKIIFTKGLYQVHMDEADFSSDPATIRVAALYIPYDNVILCGQGWFTTTIQAYATDSSYTVIQWSKAPLENGITKVKGVGLHNICIDQNYHGDFTVSSYVRQMEGIVGAGIEGLSINNLKVQNCSHYGMGLQNGGYKGCVIDGFWSENTGADGIDIKDNGSVSRAFHLNNIFVFNFGQLDEPANPWAGVDIMSLAPKASNIYVSDFGDKGQPGAGVRIKQGVLGSTTNRGTGGAWADITNITVVQNRFKTTDSESIGLHIKAPFVNYSNVACFGYEGGRIGTSVYVEERYAQGVNLQCANAIAGYQATTASGSSDRQYGDAEGCSVSGIVCRDVNVALRLNRKYQKLVNVTLKDCLVGLESGGSNAGRVIIKGLHLEGVTNPFNNLGGTYHVIEDVTGPDSGDLQNSVAVIRDSTGFARTAIVSKNAIGLYTGSTESTVGTEIARFASAIINLNSTASIDGNIQPRTANTRTIGTSSAPFAGGFTQTAYTVTSDERSKTTPLDITDEILDAAEEVNLAQYKYLDRVEEKGDLARWHFGAIAQRYVEAFERRGLDAHEFGFICYDEWGDSEAVIDEATGAEEVPAIKAGSRYGIRYEEMLVLEAAVQRRKNNRLLSRIEALESKLSQ